MGHDPKSRIEAGNSIRQVVRAVGEVLQAQGVHCGDYGHHGRDVVGSALGWNGTELLLHEADEISEVQAERVRSFVSGRLAGTPLQYLRGWEEFWKYRFRVGPGVLIPRPETELLVEILLERFGVETSLKIAELGAGSGNIGLSVLKERPRWTWIGFEKNPQTLPYLLANRQTLGVSEDRYRIVEGDFFERVEEHAPFDLLVSNPPYIASGEIAELAPEVQAEPHAALDGGIRGDECLEALVGVGRKVLKPDGSFFSEIGEDQGQVVRAHLQRAGYSQLEVLQDMAGHPRVAIGRTEG